MNPATESGQSVCFLLLVRQLSSDHPKLDELMAELQRLLQADGYQLRQRLVGWSFGMLARGRQKDLQPVAQLLARTGVRSWLVPEPESPAGMDLLRALEIGPNGIFLTGRSSSYAVDSATRVLAVLGDISGRMAQRQLKQLMAARIYQGRDQVPGMTLKEKLRTIWQGRPLLDLFLFDAAGCLTGVVRVRPGGFNPEGLGKARQPGAAGNMQVLMKRLRELAHRFVLDVDFGLAQIAGCQLCSEGERDDWLEVNARRLLRYGQIRAQMLRHRSRPVEGQEEATSTAAVAAAGPAGVLLGQAVERAERQVVEEGAAAPEASSDTTTRVLPQPPAESGHSSRVIGRGAWLLAGGLGLWGALAGTALSEWELGRLVSRYGFETGLLPALLALVLLIAGLRNLRLKRLIENTPTSRIRSLAMGLVELHGTVRREYALVAPMTQTPCAWYRLRRYRRRRNPRANQSYWQQTSVRDSGHVPFLLDDGTGRVRVDPAGATVIAGCREEGFPGQGNILTGAGACFDADEKWVEERIDEGTRLYVLGSAVPVRASRRPLRERLIERLRLLKKDPAAMRRFDANGDGHIDDGEWQAARSVVERELLDQSLAQTTERDGPRAVIVRGQTGSLPFVIAEAQSEAGLTRRLTWIGRLLLAAAGGAFVWALTLAVA